jgi:hypothetical protein
VMLVENLQRSDGIPVLAEASGYFRLVGEHGYTIRRLRLALQLGMGTRGQPPPPGSHRIGAPRVRRTRPHPRRHEGRDDRGSVLSLA